jgi:hypothetical protein
VADSIKFTDRFLRELRSRAKVLGDTAVVRAIAGLLATSSKIEPTKERRPKSELARQLLLAGLYRSRSWPARSGFLVGQRVKVINKTFQIVYGSRNRAAKPGPATQMDLKRAFDAAEKDDAINGRIDQTAAALAELLPAHLHAWQTTQMGANRPPNNPPPLGLGFLSTNAHLRILSYENFKTWVAEIQHKQRR